MKKINFYNKKINNNTIDQMVFWLRNEVKKANASGVIIGISGGIDSAVVAKIAKTAFPDNSLGVWIDVFSSKKSKEYSEIIFKESQIKKIELNLSSNFYNLKNELSVFNNKNQNEKISEGNMKSRLRMTSFYYLANNYNYLVLSGLNFSELYLGYFTKWGDGAADLYPLATFTKKQVFQIAKILNINSQILHAIPTADLYDDQSDEKDLGFSYDELELFFQKDYLKISEFKIKKIQKMHNNSKHKINVISNYFI